MLKDLKKEIDNKSINRLICFKKFQKKDINKNHIK